jgi:hypothetical protein
VVGIQEGTAVVSFVQGGLRLALSIAVLVSVGLFFTALSTAPATMTEQLPKDNQITGILALMMLPALLTLLVWLAAIGLGFVIPAIAFILVSVLLLLAGAGLLGRRRWARSLTLVQDHRRVCVTVLAAGALRWRCTSGRRRRAGGYRHVT